MAFTDRSVISLHLARTRLRSRGAVSIIFSTASSCTWKQAVRSRMRRLSKARCLGSSKNALSVIKLQCATRNSRSDRPLEIKSVMDSSVIWRQSCRSISNIEGQYRATAVTDSSVMSLQSFNFSYPEVSKNRKTPRSVPTRLRCRQLRATAVRDSSVTLEQCVMFKPCSRGQFPATAFKA